MSNNSQPPLPPESNGTVPPHPGAPAAQQNDAPVPPRPAVIPPPPISDAPATRPGMGPTPPAPQAPSAQQQQPLPTPPYGSAPAYGSAQPYGGQGANPYAQQPTGGFVAGQTPPPLAPAGPVVLELRKMIPGWLTPVLALAAVLVVGVVMAATLLGVMSSFGSVFTTLNPVQALLLGFGAVLGGGFAIESSSSFACTTNVASIGTIVALGVAIYFVTRFTMRSERGQAGPFVGVLVRSVIEAFPVAILAMIFSIFGRINISFVTVAPPLVGVLFTVWLTVAFAMIMARMRGRGASRWGTAGAIVREPIWYSVLLVSVLSVLVLIALIVMNLDKPLNALAWLPYGANAAAYAAALGQFGQLVGAQSFFATDTAMAWDVAGPWAILLILTTLLTMLYASVFIGTRRGRLVAFSPARIWQLPVGVFVLTLLYTYTLGSITMTGDGDDTWIGLSFVTSLIVAGFALVASILAEVMPGIVYGISPGMLNFLAGRRAAHVWVTGMPTFVAANVSSFIPMPPTAQTPYGAAASAAPAAFASAPIQPGQPGPGYGMGDPSPLAPAAPPRQPMSKKTKRRVIGSFVTVGVLALLIVGAFVTLSIVNSTRGPEAAVKEYVDLIAAGKAEEASKLVKPGKGEEKLQLLTDAVMSADGVTRIEVGKITSKVNGDKGQATVKMTIDGKKFSAILDVKQGDKEFGLLNTWVVDEPLVYEVELGSDIMNTVEFAAQEVSFSSDDYQTGTFLVYPGSYPVTATSNSPYLNGDELTLVVDKDTKATLSSEISDEVEAIVLEKVKEFVAECAEVPTNTESGCPDEVQDRDLAKLELTEELTEFDSFQQNTWGGDLAGDFYTREATITVTPNATSTNKSPKPKEVTFSLYGSWEIDGNDEIQVEVIYAL